MDTKKSISLLSSLLDSYLMNKDSRFIGITAGLTDSIIRVYGQGTPPPSASFDAILNTPELAALKTSYPEIYNGVKFILDYNPPPAANTIEQLTRLAPKPEYKKNIYTAWSIAQSIKNTQIAETLFKNNKFLNFIYSENNLKLLSKSLMNLGITPESSPDLQAVNGANIIEFFNTIWPGSGGKSVKKKEPKKKSPKVEPVPKDTTSKTLADAEYQGAFNRGIENAKKLFEPYGRKIPDITNINKLIEQKIEKVREEFYEYISLNKNNLTALTVEKFIINCYMVVAFKTIKYRDADDINPYYLGMTSNFKQWRQLPSLTYLDPEGSRWNRMDSGKAGKIYRVINPIIVNNIISSIPENYRQQLSGFISDLKNGHLRNIDDFCNKYQGIIGKIDSAKLEQADYVLENLGNNDINTCARLILQRIDAHNIFRQTAKDPGFVEPFKKKRDISKEKNENNSDEDNKDSKYKMNIPLQEWFNSETIKMAGAFLYKLDSAFNERPE